jgi:hypothetical protein
MRRSEEGEVTRRRRGTAGVGGTICETPPASFPIQTYLKTSHKFMTK